jgi:hypothetical protein
MWWYDAWWELSHTSGGGDRWVRSNDAMTISRPNPKKKKKKKKKILAEPPPLQIRPPATSHEVSEDWYYEGFPSTQHFMYIKYYATCFDPLGVIFMYTILSLHSSLQRDIHLCPYVPIVGLGVHKVLRGWKSLIVLSNICNRMHKTNIKVASNGLFIYFN